ncbi:MAG: cell wall protein [Marmoricola sp.]|nr:cell wall protein [Marmoricola sp.]
MYNPSLPRAATYRTTVLAPVLVAVLAVVLSVIVMVAPAFSAGSDVKINEFSSNNPDFVELINTGSGTVDLSGWVLKDNSENNSYTFPAGSTIAAGAIRGISGEGVEFAFGLGNGDAVRLYDSSANLVDSFTYPAHPAAGKSYGRCPNGTGAFVITQAATKGTANSCATPDTAVRINEFSSNNPDFVELINTGTGPVSLAGWVLKDNSENNSYTFPAGSSIAAGAILPLSGEGVQFAFGLGGGDSVRLFNASATVIDSSTYPAHPPAGKSYGRCPDGSGDFVITAAATKGTANSCPLPAGATEIKVNEVRSDPDDIVELTNTGSSTVNIGGYLLKDNDDTHVFVIPAGTTIAAGAHPTFDVNPSFGLGKGDSVRLYTPDGANLLDSTTYPADTHATTWGRCPDGTGTFGAMTATLGGTNQCGPVVPTVPNVTINEVESNGDAVGDWVELKNNGTGPVDISGWKLLDNDPAHAATPEVVPAGTTLAAGGYYALYTEFTPAPGFGLGGADSVTVYLADGTTQVDTYSWTAHAATTYGRCPDGSGPFVTTTTPTRGLANACSPVRINEIESNGDPVGDWVELKNISGADVAIGGWVFKDNVDTDVYTIPAGTVVPAGGYRVLDIADFGFGLGAGDAARLYDAAGLPIDSYTWTAHAAQTYGRCKDGLGDFVDTTSPTKGAANACPGLATSPWPGDQTVSYADRTETFTQDLSGLVFDPSDPDVLWGAQNKKGTLFKLVRDADNNWVPASGWPKDPKYAAAPNAVNGPDTEGITIGPDGFVYLASERDNDNSGVSRMSVLRYDPSSTGATITPTDEWLLGSKLPTVGANLGLEGVTWVPDSYLTGAGFKDQSTGAAYSPTTYPLHGTGLYVVAVEATGSLYAFALDSTGGTSHLVATIPTGFVALADVDFDPELGRIRAVTDDTVDGRTALLKVDAGGSFVVDTAYDRPVGMPNLNNEGLAVAPQSRCVSGKKEVLWSDDGDTDGHSLRRGSIACTVPDQPQNLAITSTAPQNAVVGQTYDVTATGGGSGNPVVLAIDLLSSSQCTLFGTTVRFNHPGACTVTASQAAAPGYLAGQTSQTIQIGRAPQAVSFAQPAGTVVGGAGVPLVASSDAGLPVTLVSATPSVCVVDGTTAKPLAAGTCTVTASQPGTADRLPATPVTRSLAVAKAPITLSTRSTSGLASLLTLKITYTSTVRSSVTGLPVAGVPVTTRINGGSPTSGCTATTNASGVATCTVGPVAIALGVGYTAAAAETPNFLAGSGSAFIGLF